MRGVYVVLTVLLVPAVRGAYQAPRQLAFGIPNTVDSIGRRDAITKTGQALIGGMGFLLSGPVKSQATESEEIPLAQAQADEFLTKGLIYEAYGVTPDSSEALAPTLRSIQKRELIQTLVDQMKSKGGAIWLGEHHNSAKDHMLQADMIRSLYEARVDGFGNPPPPMAIGLEQVQVQFQPVLDAYLAGKIDKDELKSRVQWETRWSWPFDNYLPIFDTAKELGIRLLALNVDSEDLALVEKAGLPGLDKSRIQKYITDPYGFAAFAKPPEFHAYVDYVIRPSFDLHKSMGLLKYTVSGQVLNDDEMTFRNFFSGRILWDEAMASAAYNWSQENPGGLFIGLVGADHVKFGAGIPGRFTRLAAGSRECTSVILNPSLIDTRPPGSVAMAVNAASSIQGLTLQLRYLKEGVDATSEADRTAPENTGGVLALADYLIVG